MSVFGQSGCSRATVPFIRAKEVAFGEKQFFYSGKVVVIGQDCCIRAKMVVFGQSGRIRAKMIVFDQSGCIRDKIVVFSQKWFC